MLFVLSYIHRYVLKIKQNHECILHVLIEYVFNIKQYIHTHLFQHQKVETDFSYKMVLIFYEWYAFFCDTVISTYFQRIKTKIASAHLKV